MVLEIYNDYSFEAEALQTEKKKTSICLHYTAGWNVEGAYETLKKIDKIAVHFIVGTDGKVYGTLPVDKWGYHLGIKGSQGYLDRTSISIEIVNIGTLTEKGNDLYCWTGKKYCSKTETDKFVDYKTNWRGYRYFASFPDVQLAKVAHLCGYLTKRYDIPPIIVNAPLVYQEFNKIKDFQGIFTHCTVRSNDKWDVGPAFDFKEFEKRMIYYYQN